MIGFSASLSHFGCSLSRALKSKVHLAWRMRNCAWRSSKPWGFLSGHSRSNFVRGKGTRTRMKYSPAN